MFTSWGTETAKKFTTEELTAILNALGDAEKYGMILLFVLVWLGVGDNILSAAIRRVFAFLLNIIVLR